MAASLSDSFFFNMNSDFETGIAILAGGRSRRMGRDKADLPVGTETLLQRTVRVASETGAPTIVVGRTAGPEDPEVEHRPDSPAGIGPLGGILSALERFAVVLVVPCDLPRLEKDALCWLLEAAGSLAGGEDGLALVNARGVQPLPGIYTRSCLPLAHDRVNRDELDLIGLLREARFRTIEAPAHLSGMFEGANTPEEFTRLTGSTAGGQP
jgi:molybdenum cofactor guanylyltransferase